MQARYAEDAAQWPLFHRQRQIYRKSRFKDAAAPPGRGGTLMSVRNSLEMLSQQILIVYIPISNLNLPFERTRGILGVWQAERGAHASAQAPEGGGARRRRAD